MGSGGEQRTPDGDSLAVLDLVADLAGSLERPETIRRILERSLRTLRCDRATLSRLTAESVVIEAAAGRADALTWIGRAYPLDSLRRQPPVWEAMQRRTIVTAGSLEAENAFPEFRAALLEVRHLAAIPLVHDDELVGLLVVSRYRDQAFGETDHIAMRVIGGVAALSLRNAVLHHDLERAAGVLRAAVAAAEDIASQESVGDVLHAVLRHAVEAAAADEGSIMRIDGDEVVLDATTGALAPGTRLPLDDESRSAVDGHRIVELEAQRYLQRHPAVRGVVERYARFLVVPLRVGGDVLGLIALGRRADAPFSPRDRGGVQQVAALAALLLRNARLLDEARAANHARGEFVNMAVHELRAPLGVIAGYLSLLADERTGLPERLAPLVATMAAKADEMNATVDEMLMAARLDARSLPVHAVVVDAADAVERAAARGRPAAEMRGGSVTVTAGTAAVLADPLWLDRILDNLVNNAIAYSPRAPEMTISLQAAGGAVDIRVRDCGEGIPPELQEAIFDLFVRGRSTAVPGSGLGLYLSRGMAELMGGSLVLEESLPGTGSVFRLSLPAARGGGG